MRNGASDVLFNAERYSLSAEDVFNLFEQSLHQELSPLVHPNEPEIEACYTQTLKELVEARALYKQSGLAGLLQSDNRTARALGEAIQSGEYGSLAI